VVACGKKTAVQHRHAPQEKPLPSRHSPGTPGRFPGGGGSTEGGEGDGLPAVVGVAVILYFGWYPPVALLSPPVSPSLVLPPYVGGRGRGKVEG
jgi:hypothetical protein